MVCAFMVIVCHFGNGVPYLKPLFASVVVPIFITLSFYFLTQKISKKNITLPEELNIYKQRLLRLFLPLTIWNVIYFTIYNLVLKKEVSWTDFLWQLTTGHSNSLNPPMWFMVNLIMLTLLFGIIISFYKKYSSFIFFFILIFSYYLQYTEFNYYLYHNLRFELKWPLGRFIEVAPFMSIGYFMGKYEILKIFKEQIKLQGKALLFWIVFSVFMFFYINTYSHNPIASGFHYSGIKNAKLAIIIIIFFNLLPFKKLKNLPYAFLFSTKYSMGIYCTHILVEKFIHPYLYSGDSLLYCYIIFLASYMFCFLIDLVFNQKAKYLIQ